MAADKPSSPSRLTFGRLLGFAGAFAVLQLTWQALRGTGAEWLIVHDCTVRPAVALVNWLTPDVRARAVNFSLAAQGGGINIRNGCEGMEAVFMLTAAFLVSPIAWVSRLVGLLFGIAVIFVVNQARILALFYAYRADGSLFDTLHGSVTPVAVILIVCSYFYAWLIICSRPGKTAG